MRFNRHGKWNVPFCKKPERFAPSDEKASSCHPVGAGKTLRSFDLALLLKWAERDRSLVSLGQHLQPHPLILREKARQRNVLRPGSGSHTVVIVER